jgi:hypothetical protein
MDYYGDGINKVFNVNRNGALIGVEPEKGKDIDKILNKDDR